MACDPRLEGGCLSAYGDTFAKRLYVSNITDVEH